MLRVAWLAALVGCGFELHIGASAGDDGGAGRDGSDAPVIDAPGTVARGCTLALGSDHTCVLRADGTVWCWGQNAFGELGQSMFSTLSTMPVQVQLGQTATTMATKSYHACAGLADGTAKCWGMNDNNQIGDGQFGNHAIPTTVSDLTDVTQVAVGRGHSCALRGDGSVTCWGSNSSGQLGDGTMSPKSTPSTTVIGLSSAPMQLTLASSYACALSNGVGQCWGDNAYRQLGDGTTSDRSAATTLPVDDLRQIAPSGYSVPPYAGGATCVRTAANTVSCWGSNDFGQLGNGATNMSPTSTPVQVSQLSDAVELVAGRYHVCARRQSGAVSCWGRNEYGQLGDGTKTNRSAPVTVALPRPAVHVGAGGFHTCALLDDDSLYCWGHNLTGQLGDGTQSERTAPVASHTTCQ